MKQGNVERIERTSYLLELGIDFQANDLETTYGDLRELSKEYRDNFSSKGLGKWVFIGHFDKETKTVLVKVEKELFC